MGCRRFEVQRETEYFSAAVKSQSGSYIAQTVTRDTMVFNINFEECVVICGRYKIPSPGVYTFTLFRRHKHYVRITPRQIFLPLRTQCYSAFFRSKKIYKFNSPRAYAERYHWDLRFYRLLNADVP